jgi:hypothetical protein
LAAALVRVLVPETASRSAGKQQRCCTIKSPRLCRGLFYFVQQSAESSARSIQRGSLVANDRNAQMAETIARTQVLAAKRWMEDEAGMERASLSPAEYVAYRMKVSAADAEALVAAVYALEEEE